ncbi:MAG: PBP1A family penicillin-binding protein [Actinomycetota bacterium]|nr:PBP1A family penicillin-binding protein [Actinomycetota bacterium]
MAVVGAISVLAGCSYRVELPDAKWQPRTSRIEAADGSLLVRLHGGEDRVPVPLDRVSPALRQAIVAAEDRRFWEHSGIDLRAIARALLRNTEAAAVEQGGSTITQQHVKNAYLDDGQALRRKLREVVLAREAEKRYSKEEILEQYLNTIYFGNGAYGVEAAARRYFGKRAADLGLAESAFLAGVVRGPELYDPRVDEARAQARRAEVLASMAELGMITTEEASAASAAPLQVRSDHEGVYPAPHFVEEVKRLILDDARFGATVEERRKLLFGGGLTIRTTLDPRLQALARDAAAEVLPDGGPDAAVVAVEPATGAVRALVGGLRFFSGGDGSRFNLATQARRQAGSAFKPFALVAALEQGISRRARLPAPATISIPHPAGTWKVRNFSRRHYGSLTLASATHRSVNTAYAHLVTQTGAERVVDTAARMGITSQLVPVPSAVLGTNEVTPLEMASAYATLAADGAHLAPHFVSEVTDAAGRILYRAKLQPQQRLAPELARRATHVLQGVLERGTGRRAHIHRPAAGKTGTTQNHGDAWFIGYTPRLATAVWIGFPRAATPMVPPATPVAVTGGRWPAEVWSRFMVSALAGVAPAPFPPAPPPLPTSAPRRTSSTTTTTVSPTTTSPTTTSPTTTPTTTATSTTTTTSTSAITRTTTSSSTTTPRHRGPIPTLTIPTIPGWTAEPPPPPSPSPPPPPRPPRPRGGPASR